MGGRSTFSPRIARSMRGSSVEESIAEEPDSTLMARALVDGPLTNSCLDDVRKRRADRVRASLTEAAIISGGSRTLGIERRMLSSAERISRGSCFVCVRQAAVWISLK